MASSHLSPSLFLFFFIYCQKIVPEELHIDLKKESENAEDIDSQGIQGKRNKTWVTGGAVSLKKVAIIMQWSQYMNIKPNSYYWTEITVDKLKHTGTHKTNSFDVRERDKNESSF